jgi:CRP/FNR family transcriptional regulator, anaerobic regulatory protein
MIPIKTESAWRGTSDCRSCGIRDMVLFADLNEQDFSMIHAPIDDLEIRAGSAIFQEGAAAVGIFTLRTGMIKLVRSTSDGRQRIVRVLRPGDVAGLEALAHARYDTDAVALNDVAVCRIPLSVIQTLGAQSPRLHQRLMEKWSGTLREADDWLADLNFGTARNRVCNFAQNAQHHRRTVRHAVCPRRHGCHAGPEDGNRQSRNQRPGARPSA